MADEEEDNAALNKVLLGLGVWTAEELADSTKKLYYETSLLGKKKGIFFCFICPYSYRRSSNVILHISSRHKRFVHKPAPGHHFSRENTGMPRGINIWTKEELADPTKKLLFMTTQLERIDGRYKCLSCPYTTVSSNQVVHHIKVKHPKFVHEPASCQRSNRPGTKNLNKEHLGSSQPQNLAPDEYAESPFYARRYESGLLQYSRDSDTDSDTVNYSEIQKARLKRMLNSDFEQRRRTVKNEIGDPEDEQTMGLAQHPIGESMGEWSQAQDERVDRLSDVSHGRRDTSWNLNTGSVSIEFKDVIKMDVGERDDEEDDTERRQSLAESSLVKDSILREYQAENEQLANSISSLQTSYEMEIAKLRDQLQERSVVEVNQLFCPKEETQTSTNSHLTTDRRIAELQRRFDSERKAVECLIAAQDEELEHLKQTMVEMRRQFQWESAKAKEREELLRKFSDTEYEMARSRKTIELKERAEKLKLEEELEEQRLEEVQREAQRILEVLEEKKRAKKERLQEMQKIEAELSSIH